MNLNSLFKTATEKKASDLHIVVGRPPILRIDGELKVIASATEITREKSKEMVFSILTERQQKKFVEERTKPSYILKSAKKTLMEFKDLIVKFPKDAKKIINRLEEDRDKEINLNEEDMKGVFLKILQFVGINGPEERRIILFRLVKIMTDTIKVQNLYI